MFTRPSDAVLDRNPNATMNDLLHEIVNLAARRDYVCLMGPRLAALVRPYPAGCWPSSEGFHALMMQARRDDAADPTWSRFKPS